jgi:G:T-mismatch repair DNA endonuclease (very short patch repair protein)
MIAPAAAASPPRAEPTRLAKLHRNNARDRRTRRALQNLGYQTLLIWECQTRRPATLRLRLLLFFDRD